MRFNGVINVSTPNRIFHLLDILDIDQKDFAKEIGLTDKVVSKWKTSGLKSYTKYLREIVGFFGAPPDYFLETGVFKNWDEIMEYPVSVYGKLCELLPPNYRDPMIGRDMEQLAWLDKRMCYNETGPCEVELINWFYRNVIEVKITKDNNIPEIYDPAKVELTLKDHVLANSSWKKAAEKGKPAPVAEGRPVYPPEYDQLSPEDRALVDSMIRRLIMEKNQQDTLSPSSEAGDETA